ncbi:response regulator [Sphingomonas sp. SFZ2018-12]|uniref:response regulator n=1 Tax=Sphingomonas sp. SFZ2018-12 TaxID=2683197 RepID=UPI001F118136|nr:response regulator [Sphingomonas sp. SFZ2018-12]MCH4894814.1 response regulator [Sphingomonas sp. SFZ2018-12]
MQNYVDRLLAGEFAPHGYCLLWQPELVWTHVISDGLIAASYFSIPVALVSFVRRRRDLQFGAIFWLFAMFILACGTSHLIAIWNLWHGDYGLEALIKLVTAAASVPTAILLWMLIPRLLAIPSSQQLRLANQELASMVEQRDTALAELKAQIGERERAEEALVQAQKIDAIGQLTGGIAHDFNNLLQAVAGNLELIRQQPDRLDAVKRWTQNAIGAVERGARLTHQLLAFSRVQRMELRPVEVNALIGGMHDLIQRSLTPTIRLETRLEGQESTVLADRTQLELAILNLAINSRDAMPDGGTLAISTQRTRIRFGEAPGVEPGEYVAIRVTDQGSGMVPEVARRALDPFFTTKGVGKGTGLGLSMVYGVAKQSGGALHIDTRPGQGTTVTILLRRDQETELLDVPSLNLASETPAPRAPHDDVRVMVIDDDDGVRQVIADTLDQLGYRVEAFDGGAPGLAALRDSDPALMVVDFAMPEMNGAEVVRRVRQTAPNLPIILVSGFSDSAALDAVMDADTHLLRKPFQAGDLAQLAYQGAVRGLGTQHESIDDSGGV